MMMSGSGRSSSRFPFTASQWQELEHQALVFKYMVSGMPIPPDLLFTIRRSLDSSISSKFLIHQPQHTIGWNSFHMGFGRKIDPEPGRCRRTDGKKWRCSKEAYPDSKYCERHMHRGRNRSRKPVEIISSSPSPSPSPSPTAASRPTSNPHLSSSYLSSTAAAAPSESSHFLYPHFPSSRSPTTAAAFPLSSSSQESTNFFLEPNLHSRPPPKDCRHGMKVESEEHSFFSSDSNSYSSSRLEPLAMELKQNGYHSSNLQNKIQSYDDHDHHNHNHSYRQYENNQHYYSNLEERPKKVMHHFLDEWAPKETESEDKMPTQLSISVPNSLHDFFVTQKWYTKYRKC